MSIAQLQMLADDVSLYLRQQNGLLLATLYLPSQRVKQESIKSVGQCRLIFVIRKQPPILSVQPKPPLVALSVML